MWKRLGIPFHSIDIRASFDLSSYCNRSHQILVGGNAATADLTLLLRIVKNSHHSTASFRHSLPPIFDDSYYLVARLSRRRGLANFIVMILLLTFVTRSRSNTHGMCIFQAKVTIMVKSILSEKGQKVLRNLQAKHEINSKGHEQ